MSQQGALTVVVPVREDAARELAAYLDSIGEQINDSIVPFSKLTTVHFMRWVLIDERDLVLDTSFDGPVEGHVRELVSVARKAINRIYGSCEGFDAKASTTDVVRFLLAHTTPYEAFYVGARGRSAGQIAREATLHDEIQTYLDAHSAAAVPTRIIENIRDFVRDRADLAWSLAPEPPEDFGTRASYFGPLALVIAVVLAIASGIAYWLRDWGALPAFAAGILGVVLLVAALAYGLLQTLVREEVGSPGTGKARPIDILVMREDRVVQNQLTHLVDLKGGPIRRFVIRLVLALVNFLARYLFTKGSLGGIPSIHFARWVLIGRRVYFTSNFDGSWESYLGDFVDRAALGLTAIWSNTVGFPKTLWLKPGDHWLFSGGARDEEAFKRWTRNHQIHTHVWYSAYPTLSIQNVNNNSRVRDGIAGDLHGESPEAWLRRFG